MIICVSIITYKTGIINPISEAIKYSDEIKRDKRHSTILAINAPKKIY